MKNYFIICALALAACNSSQNSRDSKTDNKDTINATADNRPAQNGRYCFIRTEGTNQQDTTTVKFTVNADIVEGEMDWIPQEKDSRKGVITGTISGDEITAVWSYMQEGMKDSMSVAFKFAPEQLAQKPLKVNTTTGLQHTDETADYTLLYTPIGCDD